ncbi:hypothetical protein [Chroococcus sp. FPU101]|uniref:hypothetical protein n=1 Tax=Chroococcus sp. FPU101 TaxID=1974212 RepID=UPI001A8EE1CB|nr:hypothetical protein [Chroococcus sp. FPU101]GFE69515.1 hypothetical protein CFPU101_21250 [Chroococcus sp. FPU101]
MNFPFKRMIGTSFISSALAIGLIFPSFAQEKTVVNLQIKRAIDAAQEIDKIPNAGELDGDYTYFTLADGVICGFLFKEMPKAAVYVICQNQVVSRSLTSVEEIEAVADLFAEQLQTRSNNAGQELARKIQEKWPTETDTEYQVSNSNGQTLNSQ